MFVCVCPLPRLKTLCVHRRLRRAGGSDEGSGGGGGGRAEERLKERADTLEKELTEQRYGDGLRAL